MYQDVASSWVSTEVYYTDPIDDRPKKYELKFMGNAPKICYWKRGRKIWWKRQTKLWKEKNSSEKELNKISKEEE